MLTYAFYIGAMVLISLCVCAALVSMLDLLPLSFQTFLTKTAVALTCGGVFIGLPYAGYIQAERNKAVAVRNDLIERVERDIAFLPFNLICHQDGNIWTANTFEAAVPCLQRADIRVVKGPRGRLLYFQIGKNGVPVRKVGITDYPVPFTFPDESGLLDTNQLMEVFLSAEHPD